MFSAVSVIVVPSKLGDINSGLAKWIVLLCGVAAGFAGLMALWRASSAANGIPVIDPTLDAENYRDSVFKSTADAVDLLRKSRWWVRLAIPLIVAAAVVSQLDGVLSKPSSSVYVLVTTGGTAICGALSTDASHHAEVGGSQLPAKSSITIVDHC